MVTVSVENQDLHRNLIASICVSEVLIGAQMFEYERPTKADFDKFFAVKELSMKQLLAWVSFEEGKISEDAYMQIIKDIGKENDAL